MRLTLSTSELLQMYKVYSVWPVGESLHWTWLEHTFELWDKGWESGAGGSLLNGNRGAFFWRQEGALREVLVLHYYSRLLILDRYADLLHNSNERTVACDACSCQRCSSCNRALMIRQ
jgi:hypothetical protein